MATLWFVNRNADNELYTTVHLIGYMIDDISCLFIPQFSITH
jgi:hypothetical protein